MTERARKRRMDRRTPQGERDECEGAPRGRRGFAGRARGARLQASSIRSPPPGAWAPRPRPHPPHPPTPSPPHPATPPPARARLKDGHRRVSAHVSFSRFASVAAPLGSRGARARADRREIAPGRARQGWGVAVRCAARLPARVALVAAALAPGVRGSGARRVSAARRMLLLAPRGLRAIAASRLATRPEVSVPALLSPLCGRAVPVAGHGGSPAARGRRGRRGCAGGVQALDALYRCVSLQWRIAKRGRLQVPGGLERAGQHEERGLGGGHRQAPDRGVGRGREGDRSRVERVDEGRRRSRAEWKSARMEDRGRGAGRV